MTDISVEALRALPAQELNRLATDTAARFMGGLPWGSPRASVCWPSSSSGWPVKRSGKRWSPEARRPGGGSDLRQGPVEGEAFGEGHHGLAHGRPVEPAGVLSGDADGPTGQPWRREPGKGWKLASRTWPPWGRFEKFCFW